MHLSKFLGSSLSLPAHGWVGTRATSFLAAHFALRKKASNSAEKKGSPRLRLSATDGQASEGVAEGGGWGEEFRHARAETRSGVIRAIFVQKRFELRSVIATKQKNAKGRFLFGRGAGN